MSAIHTLAFPRESVLGDDADPEARLAVAAQLVATIGAVDGGGVVALPAGWVQARSDEERDAWAEALRAASQESGVGIVFGIDVGEAGNWGAERRPRSFAYACDRGRRLLWPATAARSDEGLAQRVVTVGGLRLLVLVGREIFLPGATPVAAAERPDLVIVLAHGGATAKWLPGLTELDAKAPTLVVRQELPMRNLVWTDPPRGWLAESRRSSRVVRVVSYRRERVGVAAGDVGN